MQQLGIEELEELLDEVQKRITIANQNGTLEKLLESMGMGDLVAPPCLDDNRNGKIVVIGASEVSEKDLRITAGKYGIEKSRLEFNLDYESLQKYNYRKLQYSDIYRVILVGPIPHSAKEKGDSSSIIAEMESHPEMYPRMLKLSNGNELKITKNTFKAALAQLIDENYISRMGDKNG